MLLPSLIGARNKARDLQCKSNMKQMGLGIASYSHSNNAQLPSHRVNSSESSDGSGWTELLKSHMSETDFSMNTKQL